MPHFAQLGVPSNFTRQGSDIARWTADHRAAVLIIGTLILIAILLLLVKMKRDC